MNVAVLANAMEQYYYQKNKLDNDKSILQEYKILDSAYKNEDNDMLVQKQQLKVSQDKIELIKLLNTDIKDVPLINPVFDKNENSGFLFDEIA